MALKIIAALAVTLCDLVVDSIDIGAGSGHVKVYDGTRPASPATAVSTQVMLVDYTLPEPAFGNAVAVTGGATATAATISNTTAAASGTASWFRVFDGSGNAVFDGDITLTGSGGDLTMSALVITAGMDTGITGFTYTQPKGY